MNNPVAFHAEDGWGYRFLADLILKVDPLNPALSASLGATRAGVLGIEVTDPGVSLTVQVGSEVVIVDESPPAGTPCLRGDAVAVLEALSMRVPHLHPLDPDDRWLVEGLAVVFDVA